MAVVLTIADYSRRTSAHFNLGAHFLNLRGVLFKLRSDKPHVFLEITDRRSLLLYFTSLLVDLFVFFEELVEQHLVHLLVAHLSAGPVERAEMQLLITWSVLSRINDGIMD